MSTLRVDTLQTTDSTFTVDLPDLATKAYVSTYVDANVPLNKLASIANFAALASVDTTKFTYAKTFGYYTPGDGGACEFYWSGSAWVRSMNSKINIKQFGAKGDKVTDDTAAVTAAINYITANGGELFFPRGTYRVTSAITIASAQKAFCLRGETIPGQDDTPADNTTQILFQVADGVNGIYVYNTVPALTRCVSMYNLHIHRLTNETKGGGGVGLYLRGVFEGDFDNLTVTSFDRTLKTGEIDFGGGNVQPTISCSFRHCNFRDGSTENLLLEGFTTLKFDLCNIIGGTTTVQDQLITINRPGTFCDSAFFNNCVIISVATVKPARTVRVMGGFFHIFDSCALEQGVNCFDIQPVSVSLSTNLVNLFVSKCHINGHTGSVLNFISPGRVMFLHNRVDGASQTSGNLLQVVSVTVSDMECIIDGNDITFKTGFGVYLNNVRGVQIVNNRFRSTTGSGTAVYLEPSTAGCVVMGNTTKTTGTDVSNFGTNVSANNTKY